MYRAFIARKIVLASERISIQEKNGDIGFPY
jgi:hypothetical protein